jgi:hypothetical protein
LDKNVGNFLWRHMYVADNLFLKSCRSKKKQFHLKVVEKIKTHV